MHLKEILALGAEDIAQLIKCLPYKLKDLSLIPSTHNDNNNKKQAWWYMLVIPVLRKQRQEDLHVSLASQPAYHSMCAPGSTEK